MPRGVTPFLMFSGDAEEAMRLYVAVFADARSTSSGGWRSADARPLDDIVDAERGSDIAQHKDRGHLATGSSIWDPARGRSGSPAASSAVRGVRLAR